MIINKSQKRNLHWRMKKNNIKREREKLEKDKQRFLREKRDFEKELRKVKTIPKHKIKSKTPSNY